ncbi:hypothetical protein [Asticcacaulis machinosus]|uniref:DNA-binding protein n=1 Tax=Asticcacaulis machinosus TaxID=2984211 RepID=A0ABT5HH26_9CAUL|nr:hypothetical protein [Asticcacaulis machinosus]MDC7675401.1 hypothetical protein [Asticcacaulis machinosus]
MSVAQGARAIGVSQQTLERNLLPPSNERFSPASVETRVAVRKYTKGEIKLDDWFERPETDEEGDDQ